MTAKPRPSPSRACSSHPRVAILHRIEDSVHEVVIIGAGFAGLGAAIALKRAGIERFVMLESADEVGGTWRDNTYPGAACDVPSQLYSFSFDLNPDWSHAYAQGEEIQRYLVGVSHRHGVRPHLRFGRRVIEARWIEDAKRWLVRTDAGEVFEARALIAAVGGLRDPAYPNIQGRDTFAGPAMHSARWDHGVDLRGKRIGVIGTGASAIQIVPAVREQAASVTLFQRTPPWVFPRFDHSFGERRKRLYRRLPFLQRMHRASVYARMESRFVLFGPTGARLAPTIQNLARRYMERHIGDPELRRQLIPRYRMGCKRMLISDDYFEALSHDDVSLITDHIGRITPTGIVTEQGQSVDLDVLVYCTGFNVKQPLGSLEVHGRDGAELSAEWRARPRAYLGATIPGFPNLFVMVGPNSGLGHNSIVFMIEAQLRYIMDAIQRLKDVAAFDLRAEVLDDFQREIDQRMQGMVWSSGCESWYLGPGGEQFVLWPGSTIEYWWRTRRFDPTAYRIDARNDTRASTGAALEEAIAR